MTYKYSIAFNKQLHKFSHQDFDALVVVTSDFLVKNNINFNKEDLKAAIRRQSAVSTKPKGKVTFADAVNGAKALMRYASGKTVSQAEVTRRSNICPNCPHISQVSMCGSCGTAGKATRFINNFKKLLGCRSAIDTDIQYSYCEICNCSLALMVVSSMDSFHKDQGRPDNCWLNPKSPNYVP